jgi:hypothetical protein
MVLIFEIRKKVPLPKVLEHIIEVCFIIPGSPRLVNLSAHERLQRRARSAQGGQRGHTFAIYMVTG